MRSRNRQRSREFLHFPEKESTLGSNRDAHSVSTGWNRETSAHQLKSHQLKMVENIFFALTHSNQQC